MRILAWICKDLEIWVRVCGLVVSWYLCPSNNHSRGLPKLYTVNPEPMNGLQVTGKFVLKAVSTLNHQVVRRSPLGLNQGLGYFLCVVI